MKRSNEAIWFGHRENNVAEREKKSERGNERRGIVKWWKWGELEIVISVIWICEAMLFKKGFWRIAACKLHEMIFSPPLRFQFVTTPHHTIFIYYITIKENNYSFSKNTIFPNKKINIFYTIFLIIAKKKILLSTLFFIFKMALALNFEN